MKNKVLIISLICLVVVIAFGSYLGFRYFYYSDKALIYTNDKKIAQDGDLYSYINRVGDTTNKEFNIDFTGFSGTDSIWVIDSQNKTKITFEFTSEVSRGKFKGVLITPYKRVLKLFEGNSTGNYYFDDKGTYTLKIVGDNTDGKVMVKVDAGENGKVSVVKK